MRFYPWRSHVLTVLDANSGIQASPTHMTAYSPSHGPSASSMQQSSPSTMSRLRATSAAFPPGLDLRNQYRGLTGQQQQQQQQQHQQQHLPHGLPPTPRGTSFSGTFTGGFASAPLSAPVDFAIPRTPIEGGQTGRDFNIPQLSAPMQPPQDFQSAYSANLSPRTQQHRGERGFGNQVQNNGDQGGQTQGQSEQQQHHQGRSNSDTTYLRQEYETGEKRKRSFTMPGQFSP